MSKSLNAALIDGLARELEGVDSCVVVGASAMTVAEVSAFRTKLRGQDFRMRVVKNSLAKLAFEQVGMPGLDAVLDGPSAVIHGGEGCLAISKLVADEKRTAKDKLQIHGGFNEGEVVDSQGIDVLSKVPGRKELLAMCMGGFFGPVSNLSQSMDDLFTEMHGLLEALIDSKGGAE
ncbi:MAG: 50S ribosomal protein L10 [Planctomycetes bacterium]|nr:50S ribosomal protein L10 [Planctomycetota bacterium]